MFKIIEITDNDSIPTLFNVQDKNHASISKKHLHRTPRPTYRVTIINRFKILLHH